MRADALATALIILGPEKGSQLAESERLAAYFIIKKGQEFLEVKSSGFKQLSGLE